MAERGRWSKAACIGWTWGRDERPGGGGNCQTIAKATSCQDNAGSIGVPEALPTLMLIAFQCLEDNLQSNCFFPMFQLFSFSFKNSSK